MVRNPSVMEKTLPHRSHVRYGFSRGVTHGAVFMHRKPYRCVAPHHGHPAVWSVRCENHPLSGKGCRTAVTLSARCGPTDDLRAPPGMIVHTSMMYVCMFGRTSSEIRPSAHGMHDGRKTRCRWSRVRNPRSCVPNDIGGLPHDICTDRSRKRAKRTLGWPEKAAAPTFAFPGAAGFSGQRTIFGRSRKWQGVV